MKKVYLTSIRKLKNLREKAINVFDVESDIKGFFKMVGFCRLTKSKKKDCQFDYTIQIFKGKNGFNDFVEFLFNQKIDILYCYNIKFDSRYLGNYLIMNRKIRFSFIQSSSQLLGVRLYKFENDIEISILFKDFFPFCLTKLENISKKFNTITEKFPKFDEKDEKKLEKLWEKFFKNCSLEELEKHNINDVKLTCELIYNYRLLIFNKFNIDLLDKRLFSLASLTMKIFRANSITEKIDNSFLKVIFNKTTNRFSYFLDEYLYNFVRKTYKGGYCANFSTKIHKGVITLDITSSYSFQPLKIKFPIGEAYHTYDFNTFEKATEIINGFAKVIVNFNHKKYYLPVIREDKKLGRVYGQYEGYLTSIELKWLKSHKIKYEFLEGFYFVDYDKTECLKNYMLEMFKNKNAENDESALREIFKRLLNSLTGKFGQKCEVTNKVDECFLTEKEIMEKDSEELDTKLIYKDIYYCFKLIDRQSIKTYQMISWISLITAYGRIQLMDMIFKTNALYCDTDSVKILGKNYEKVKHLINSELGGWKYESIDELYRGLAPKAYCYLRLDKKTNKKIKGIKYKGIQKKFYTKNLWNSMMKYNGTKCISVENIPQMLTFRQALSRKNVLEQDILIKYDEITKNLNPIQKI